MMWFRVVLLAAALVASAHSALSQAPADQRSVVAVIGHGEADQSPDFAVLSYIVRGEGKTAEEALRAFAENQKRVNPSVQNLPDATQVKIESHDLNIAIVHAKACETNADEPTTHLSTGDCAVSGYVVTSEVHATIAPAKLVGNAASFATQMGATDEKLDSTGVFDRAALRQRAIRAAIVDADAQAHLIASASGSRLGSLISVADKTLGDNGSNLLLPPPPPPEVQPRPAAPPLISIGFLPAPITETADFSVVYELRR